MRTFLFLTTAAAVASCATPQAETKTEADPAAAPAPAPVEKPKPTRAGLPLAPGLDEASMDPAADPCTDFYQYACGGWMKTAEIPADRPLTSRGFIAPASRTSHAW